MHNIYPNSQEQNGDGQVVSQISAAVVGSSIDARPYWAGPWSARSKSEEDSTAPTSDYNGIGFARTPGY